VRNRASQAGSKLSHLRSVFPTRSGFPRRESSHSSSSSGFRLHFGTFSCFPYVGMKWTLRLLCPWQAPPHGVYKMNTDAAIFNQPSKGLAACFIPPHSKLRLASWARCIAISSSVDASEGIWSRVLMTRYGTSTKTRPFRTRKTGSSDLLFSIKFR